MNILLVGKERKLYEYFISWKGKEKLYEYFISWNKRMQNYPYWPTQVYYCILIILEHSW